MVVTPASTVAGCAVARTVGLVRGSAVRARHLGEDFIARIKGLVGGELEEYSSMVALAHAQALDRMTRQATSLGANAVLDVRVSTTYLMGSAVEILAYGNAVVLDVS